MNANAKDIWVFVETAPDGLAACGIELLDTAAQLADAYGGASVAVVAGKRRRHGGRRGRPLRGRQGGKADLRRALRRIGRHLRRRAFAADGRRPPRRAALRRLPPLPRAGRAHGLPPAHRHHHRFHRRADPERLRQYRLDAARIRRGLYGRDYLLRRPSADRRGKAERLQARRQRAPGGRDSRGRRLPSRNSSALRSARVCPRRPGTGS